MYFSWQGVNWARCCLWKMNLVTGSQCYLETKAAVILMWSGGAANTHTFILAVIFSLALIALIY